MEIEKGNEEQKQKKSDENDDDHDDDDDSYIENYKEIEKVKLKKKVEDDDDSYIEDFKEIEKVNHKKKVQDDVADENEEDEEDEEDYLEEENLNNFIDDDDDISVDSGSAADYCVSETVSKKNHQTRSKAVKKISRKKVSTSPITKKLKVIDDLDDLDDDDDFKSVDLEQISENSEVPVETVQILTDILINTVASSQNIEEAKKGLILAEINW